ncbi:MAG: Fic family protein [Pseudomonadota bacterium]
MASADEPISMMEPMLISDSSKYRSPLADMALTLATEATAFKNSLPEVIIPQLAQLIRAMNCYYSNLIEGHNTHPVDIERALKDDYNADNKKRNLQLEAKAHIMVQEWIDSIIHDDNISVTTSEFIMEIHKRFYDNVPDELLHVEDPYTKEFYQITAGLLRTRDVQVGRHIAIHPESLEHFMTRFENAYSRLGKIDAILAVASAHHRLLWIHPFLDGNGRVARLLSHAMLCKAIDTGSLWSVSRGLARNETTYKSLLAACDLGRRNDLDGRGSLSEEALYEFNKFFLEVCLDQVRFMRDLIEPQKLHTRILLWVREAIAMDVLPKRSDLVMEVILHRGEINRSDVAHITGVTDRHARRITSALINQEVVTSGGPRSPLTLSFPARLAYRWMPGLFPEQVG